MANERLRSSIAAAGLTIEAVAKQLVVDPKTVDRWIRGRQPRTTLRWDLAALLKQDEAYLWPELLDDAKVQAASDAEFVRLYPHRGMVPPATWTQLVDNAKDCLDVLVYSGLFLFDNRPDLADALIERAKAGVRVRFLVGDADSPEIRRRSEEEGIGTDGLPGRIHATLSYLSKAVGTPGIEIRRHDTILYNSIFRSDITMLVNPHVYGSGAPANPVIHLQRVPGGRMFDHYQSSFEKVWEAAKPKESTS